MKERVFNENFDWSCENIVNFYHFIINNPLLGIIFMPQAETLTKICEENLEKMTLFQISMYKNFTRKIKSIPSDQCHIKFLEKFEQTKFFNFFSFEELTMIHKALVPSDQFKSEFEAKTFPSNTQGLYNEICKRSTGATFGTNSFMNFFTHLSYNKWEESKETSNMFNDINDKILIEFYDVLWQENKFLSLNDSKYSNHMFSKLIGPTEIGLKPRKFFIMYMANKFLSELAQCPPVTKTDITQVYMLYLRILKPLTSEYIYHGGFIHDSIVSFKTYTASSYKMKLGYLSPLIYSLAKINYISILKSENKHKFATEFNRLVLNNVELRDTKDFGFDPTDSTLSSNYMLIRYVWALAVFNFYEPKVIRIFVNNLDLEEKKMKSDKAFYIGQIHSWISLEYPKGPQISEENLEIILRCRELDYPIRYDSGLRECVYKRLINPERYEVNYFDYPHYIEFADIESKVAIVIEDPSEEVVGGEIKFHNGLNELKCRILKKKGWNVYVVTLESLAQGDHSDVLTAV